MRSTLPFGPGGWRLAGFAGLLSLGTSFAASAQAVLWRDNPEQPATTAAYKAQLRSYRAIDVQLPALRAALLAAPAENGAGVRHSTVVIALPTPTGGTERFRISQAPVMDPQLAAKYPEIQTYQGQGIEDPSAIARLDVTPGGFHAMVSGPHGRYFIDPAVRWGNPVSHLVFAREAMKTQSFVCVPDPLSVATPGVPAPGLPHVALRQNNGSTLKTYRLALANTYEYATAVGGTALAVASAKATTLNRINGVYEREIAVRMVLVPNNNLLDFVRGGANVPSPVYTDNNPNNVMLGQNQTNVDRVIGAANYDIGHVVSTGGGGVARRPSVCVSGMKAMGVTGSAQPVGDAFDIDFVAHEMGHQFNGNHTFNAGTAGNCTNPGTRSASTAYEPGSGVTIMAYAGICSPEDIAPNSIDTFHSVSFDEVLFHINGAANACAVRTATNNTPPVAGNSGSYTIPKSTPFALTGSATDVDGDPLTYEWEEFDKQNNTTSINAPSGDQPIFRPFLPSTSPTRYFPRLSDITNNRQTIGERLPTYGRIMNFRFVVRDNRSGGGGVDYGTARVTVDANSGPLLVTQPNTSNIIWQAGAPAQVTWNVAGTDLAPVSAANVDVLLSTDGGNTFPFVLATATANDGTQTITVPLSAPASTTARVMVRASGNVFFDISNQNFTIEGNNGPTFFLAPAAATATACPGTPTALNVALGQITGFTGTVTLGTANLPAGFGVSYTPASAAAGSTVVANITAAAGVAAGTYSLTLTGVSGGVTHRQLVSVSVAPVPTQAATAQAPSTTPARTILRPQFTWSAVASSTTYELQVSTSSTFATGTTLYTTANTTFTAPTAFAANTTYFWRVRGTSACGNAPYSNTLSFTTGSETCATTVATQVPRSIGAGAPLIITSVINVTDRSRVGAVRVRNLDIQHSAVNEIEVSLTNPAGTTVVLIPRNACLAGDDYLVSFDDQAAAAFTCPASTGATYRPAAPLSALTNGAANGNWTLTVTDNTPGNGGLLAAWSLELCTLAEAPNAPTAIAVTNYGWTAARGGENEALWTVATTGAPATYYELQHSYQNNTSWMTIATIPVADGPIKTDYVALSGRYYYRVRACNANGCSEYTSEASVLQSRAVAAQAAGVTVSPNPSNGLFQVAVDNAQRGPVALRVTDALGRTIQSETLVKSAAALAHTVDLSRLAPGVYNLHLALPDGTVVTRLLKQ